MDEQCPFLLEERTGDSRPGLSARTVLLETCVYLKHPISHHPFCVLGSLRQNCVSHPHGFQVPATWSQGLQAKETKRSGAVPSFSYCLPLSLLLAFMPWGDVTIPAEMCPDAESHPPCSQKGKPLLPGYRAQSGLEGPGLTPLPWNRTQPGQQHLPHPFLLFTSPRVVAEGLGHTVSSLRATPSPHNLSLCPQPALVRSCLPEATKTKC